MGTIYADKLSQIFICIWLYFKNICHLWPRHWVIVKHRFHCMCKIWDFYDQICAPQCRMIAIHDCQGFSNLCQMSQNSGFQLLSLERTTADVASFEKKLYTVGVRLDLQCKLNYVHTGTIVTWSVSALLIALAYTFIRICRSFSGGMETVPVLIFSGPPGLYCTIFIVPDMANTSWKLDMWLINSKSCCLFLISDEIMHQ